MKGLLRKGYLILLLVTCISTCVAIPGIIRYFEMEDSLLSLRPAATFNSNWQLAEDDVDTPLDTVPRSLTVQYGAITLHNVLPDALSDEAALVYRINDEGTRVLVNNKEVFSYGMDEHTPFGRSYGTVWLTVPLSSDMAGQPVTVEIHAISDEASDGDYTFYLDQHNTVLTTIFRNNLPLIITCTVGFVLATLLLAAGLFSIHSGLMIAKPRAFLALFVFTGQFWVLAQADLLQFIIGNKAAGHFIAHAVFMLMPVFFALYLSVLLQNRARHYQVLVAVFSGYLLTRMLLYFLNILDISAFTSVTHLLIGFGVTYAVSLFMIDKNEKVNPIVRIGVLFFFVFAIISMVHYWLVPYLNTDMPIYALLLGIGIDLLMVFFYSALLLNHRYLASNRMRFEQQAYTDAMTQVNNRSAYDFIVPTLKPENYPKLTLIMFDMNTLKQVNDTLGHLAGDKLVCALVNYLQLSFSAIGKIYRFGGDEFVVVIENAPIEEVHAARADFDRLLKEHSQHGGNEISVAIGMASRQEREFAGLSADGLLHQADKAMYAMKTIMKSRPSMHEISSERLKQIDPLTGILTFDAFKACVYDALTAQDYHFPCIIAFDLNFFDGYNSLFGWDEGNQLLQKMANLSLKLCGDKGFCAHGNSDHFYVFADMPDLDSLTALLERETARFQKEAHNCLLFPSFGIYPITDHKLPVSTMCSRAANAQKRIKGRLDTLYAVYSSERQSRRNNNMKLLSTMRKAMDENTLDFYYQPKFSGDGKQFVGAEVIMHWPAEESATADFVELFERSGLILTLDWHILENTCREVRRLLDKGISCVPISTNFSRLHVYEKDCVSRLQQLLEKYQLPSKLIGIEFTSTTLSHDANVNARLNALYGELQKIGVCVTLDDFDSRLTVLADLDQLHTNVVKIHCKLATDTADMAPELSIFRYATNLCRSSGIRTLVDNIDTEEQLTSVLQFGCDMVQGNYISPPLPMANFESLLMQYQEHLIDQYF